MGVYDERRVKIVATLGPASAARKTLAALFEAGVDVVRINAAHGSPDERARMINDVRSISGEMGRMVPILFDLRGLKIRTGPLPEGKKFVRITEGQQMRLVPGPVETGSGVIGIRARRFLSSHVNRPRRRRSRR